MGRLANISRKHEESNSLRPADAGGTMGPADKALGPRPQEARFHGARCPWEHPTQEHQTPPSVRRHGAAGRTAEQPCSAQEGATPCGLCPSLHRSVPSLTPPPNSNEVSARHPLALLPREPGLLQHRGFTSTGSRQVTAKA